MSAKLYFERLLERYTVEKDRLNALDTAVGDGDHGTTMLRGLTRAASAEGGKRAKAFMRASGGASGTLFGLILLSIEAHLDSGDALDLSQPCDRICDLGEVIPGDKSMVDALSPAVMATGDGLAAMIAAAAAGRDGTRDMTARRGRAQYVEDGGRGHIDPGAASVVILLETLAEVSA